jgi:hypothetical protein
MAISYSQLEGYWIGAGGSPAAAPLAAAIAMAESGGNPNAHNAKPPDDSYGLWQINMLGSMGPSRRAQFGLSSNTQLFDPATNARAAVAISGGGKSFAAWSTFGNGAYRQFLNGNVPPDMNAGGAGGTANATQASLGGDIANSVISALYPVINMSGNLVAFATLIIFGGILSAAGLYMLFKETGVAGGAGAAGTAIRVVGGPVGRAATGLGSK